MRHYDSVLLAMDEAFDNGIVLDTDGSAIADLARFDELEAELSSTEQSIANAFQSAKEQLARNFLR